MMEHVMVDLETLGTRPGSVIFALGAVFFHPVAGLGEEFYQVIDVASSCVAGLSGDAGAMSFWKRASPEARTEYDKAFSGLGRPLTEVLNGFGGWLDDCGPGKKLVQVWGNGAAFDNAILAEAYKRAGVGLPWEFHNDRCFRTLKNLSVVNPALKPRFEGTPHHALHDAKHQARWAIAIMQQLIDRGTVVRVRETLDDALVDAVLTGTGAHRVSAWPLPTEAEARSAASEETARKSEGDYEPAINQARQGMLKAWPTCQTCGSVLTPSLTCPQGTHT